MGMIKPLHDLRVFYARFETSDFSLERKAIRQQLQHETPPITTADEVCIIFNKIDPKKATGPDQIRGRILKECSEQLSPIFRQLFQRSLDRHYIVKVCKSSIIVPVPKVVKPSVLTDYIPIALTSITMKSLECIVLKYFLSNVVLILYNLPPQYLLPLGQAQTMFFLCSSPLHLIRTGPIL